MLLLACCKRSMSPHHSTSSLVGLIVGLNKTQQAYWGGTSSENGGTPKLAGWFIENGKYPNQNNHVQYMGVSIAMGVFQKWMVIENPNLKWMMMTGGTPMTKRKLHMIHHGDNDGGHPGHHLPKFTGFFVGSAIVFSS